MVSTEELLAPKKDQGKITVTVFLLDLNSTKLL